MPLLETTSLPADAIEVGRIADAWGIKGWFKVHAFSSNPEALFAAKAWFLQPADKGAKRVCSDRFISGSARLLV